jgi:hypothetical protein
MVRKGLHSEDAEVSKRQPTNSRSPTSEEPGRMSAHSSTAGTARREQDRRSSSNQSIKMTEVFQSKPSIEFGQTTRKAKNSLIGILTNLRHRRPEGIDEFQI